MDRLRILIVSYYFPPAAGGGVQRVLGWAKFLPRFGVDVEVLAPDDPGWLQKGGVSVPEGVQVHRTRNLSPKAVLPSRELAGASGLRRLGRKLALQPRRLLMPDMHIGWARSAVPRGVAVVRRNNVDLIISTSPPKTCHVIASRISSKTGVPWIADYRDSWLDLPHLRLDRRSVRARHTLDVRYARRLMRNASAITTVSNPLATDLRRRHPGVAVQVVPNGVDLEARAELPPAPDLADGARRSEKFVVAYTGNFFGRQSPQTFLAAARTLLERRPELQGQVRLRFIGQLKAADHAAIEASSALSSSVERIEFLHWRDALAEQHAADLLFLYVAAGRGSEGVYTGKVFEYVAAQRPILALAPSDNVAAQLVGRAGSGTVVDPDDVPGIERALEQAVDSWLADGRQICAVPEGVLAEISREHHTERLAEFMRTLL